MTVFETDLQIISTEEGEGNEIRRPIVRATGVVEQRVSHFLMGLGIIGTMTGPLLIVLHTMPRAIFCGVFFVVGWGSIESNGITKKLLFLMSERRFVQQAEPLLQVRRRKIWLYLMCQIVGVILPVAISQTIAAIGKLRSPSFEMLNKLTHSDRLPSTGLRTDSLPLEDDAEVVHCERTRDYGRLDSKQ